MKQLHQQLYLSGQITADDFTRLADAGIKVIINNRPDGEEPNQLSQTEASALAEQHGIEYHYLPMANGQPLPPTLISDFRDIIENTQSPILAHCRSGMRSSIIWALGQLESGNLTPEEVINSAASAGIMLENYRPIFENAYSS